MGMRINTNIEAFNAQRNLNATATQYAKSVEKLSSGLRINRAGDDAAGLSISEKLRAQTRGLAQAQRNAQDGISMIQTAEGALNETHSILQRMRELGVQAANGTLSNDDRTSVVSELKQLKSEIDRISTVTDFNGTKLLSGGATTTTAASLGSVTKSNSSGDTGTAGGTFTGSSDVSYTVKATAVATTFSSADLTAANSTTATSSDTLTGAASGSFSVKVTAATNGAADTVAVSTDGGTSWGSDINVSNGVADLGNGVSITLGGTQAQNDVVSFTADNYASKIQYSTDGGTTYNGSDITVSGTSAATLNNGVTFAFGNTAASSVNDTFSFTATASTSTVGAKTLDLQIGANNSASEKLTVSINATGTANIGDASATAGNPASLSAAVAALDVTTPATADFLKLVDSVDQAIKDVSKVRGDLGANQNRLEHTIANLGVSQENLTASESRIRDVDMASEMVNFTKTGILQQAGQAILAQANQAPQGVLSLLKG